MPMSNIKSKRIVSIVPRELAERLEEEAKKANRTVSNYVAWLIERELNRSEQEA